MRDRMTDDDQSKRVGAAEILKPAVDCVLKEFNFSRKITDYARILANLTPRPYDRDPPVVGDTVIGLYFSFFDIEINTGVIVRVMDSVEELPEILEEMEIGYEPESDEYKILDRYFDCIAGVPFLSVSGYIVEFGVPVTMEFLGLHTDIANIEPGTTTIASGGVEAKVIKLDNGDYKITGKLKCLLDSNNLSPDDAGKYFKLQQSTQSEVEHVAWSSGLLTSDFLVAFNETLDDLAEKEVADFHPGSGGVVRDLVHPSMYCYVQGQSAVQGVPGDPLSTVAYKPSTSESESRDFWGRQYEESIHQWLPSEFMVAQDGSTQIASYINNLDRDKYPQTYGLLEKLFERVLPLFEAVCGSLRNDFYGDDNDYEVDDGNPVMSKSIPLRNRTLQVITKIVEYRVSDEANFDGVWHVEGMSHEEILATGLCIIKRDQNFAGAEIEFRRFLFQSEGNDLISYTPQNASPPIDTLGDGYVRPLGKLETPVGQVIVFPNSHIHRLSSMYSTDDVDAVRRIVVFWLVNPERPILSTANVSPQQALMPHAVALRNRLALMAERKFHKENYSQREVSLCEH